MLKLIGKLTGNKYRRGTPLIFLLVTAIAVTGCNFVDPGEKTTVPFGSDYLRLPIYKVGDFLRYDVQGSISIGNSLPINITGRMEVKYLANTETVVPSNLDPAIDPSKVLKEIITLNVGNLYTSERYVYQNQDSADPLYGAMYLVALGNQQTGINKKFTWPGQSNLVAPQLIMKPVVFSALGADKNLDPVAFDLYIDCDATGVIDVNCPNGQWAHYQESSQLTNVGNNNYGFFYNEKTYLTATVTKTLWQITFQNQNVIDKAKTEGFSGNSLESTQLSCANVPSTGSIGSGSGQYFYLNQVGVVTMSSIACSYTADSSGTSQLLNLNIIELIDARVGGVNLNNIL